MHDDDGDNDVCCERQQPQTAQCEQLCARSDHFVSWIINTAYKLWTTSVRFACKSCTELNHTHTHIEPRECTWGHLVELKSPKEDKFLAKSQKCPYGHSIWFDFNVYNSIELFSMKISNNRNIMNIICILHYLSSDGLFNWWATTKLVVQLCGRTYSLQCIWSIWIWFVVLQVRPLETN